MNTLHLDFGREMRGGQLQAMRLMCGLRDRGHGVVLLARKESPLLECAQRERIHAEALTWWSLVRAARHAQVVHAHDARSHLFAALLSRKPLVVSRRVIFHVGRGSWSRWKYGRARAYAAVSKAVRRELKRAGVPEEKIRVIYDGVPLLEESWDEAGPTVIPRSSDKRKGSSMAAEAAVQAGGPVLVSRNLEQDLRGANLMVYITKSEGLGSAALLAMSAGIPVIASDVGGLKEVVLNGKTGMRVKNNVEAIARAVRDLRGRPEKARKMGTRARRMVAENFSIHRMVDQTLEMYEAVLRAP
jgi:hypothetical protein